MTMRPALSEHKARSLHHAQLRRHMRGLASLVALFCVTVLPACSSVFDTTSIREPDQTGCRSEAGGYFLPKKHVEIAVSQGEAAGGDASQPFVLTLGATRSVPDGTRPYCLDYIGSVTSEDDIKVIRDSNSLLTMISSTTEDKLKDIIEKAVTIGLIAATGNPDFGLRAISFRTDQGARILAYHNFDPFDRRRLAEINVALRDYGYCVLVVKHTVDLNRLSPAQRRAFPATYCGNPHGFVERVSEDPTAMLELIPPDEVRRGILYRAEQTHQFVVFRKRDPKSFEPWDIYMTKQLEMPNLSPVFSVAVDRSFFVKRETTLLFNSGVLQDVTIDKPSEMLEVAGLTLKIVQAAVSVPAEIVQVRITSNNNRTRLLQAQRELIMTRAAYISALKTQPANAAALIPGRSAASGLDFDGNRDRAARDVADCLARCAGGSDREMCQQRCSPGLPLN